MPTRVAVALLALLVAGCGSTTTESTTPSPSSRCQVSISSPGTAPAAGAALAVPLTTSRDCLWSARSEADWLTLEPTSGQGESLVTVSVGSNPQGRTRAGTIVVNDARFNIAQEATPCRFELEPRQVSIRHQGGRTAVQVTALEGCVWTTSVTQRWVRIVNGACGEWNGVVDLASTATRVRRARPWSRSPGRRSPLRKRLARTTEANADSHSVREPPTSAPTAAKGRWSSTPCPVAHGARSVPSRGSS